MTGRWYSVHDAASDQIRALLVAVAAPLLGFWAGFGRVATLNTQANEALGLSMADVCVLNKTIGNASVASLCSDFQLAGTLQRASFVTGFAGLLLVAGISLLALWAGSDRTRNARSFPLVVPVAIALIGVLTVSQAGIVLFSAYLVGIRGRVILLLVLGGLAAALTVIFSLRVLFKKPPILELALPIPDSPTSAVWQLVRDVANTVGAAVPRNIIIGVTPNFYATANAVTVPGAKLPNGETLFLSLPLLRLLQLEEIRAVIGHELGHFIGEDVLYSMRFAPAYRALRTGLLGLQTLGGGIVQSVARAPAIWLTSFVLSRFAVNERRVSRGREFEADRVGASAASPKALAAALAKISLVAELLKRRETEPAPPAGDKGASGRWTDPFVLMVRGAADRARSLVTSSLDRDSVKHPLDSHPPTGDRLTALGVDPAELSLDFGPGWADEGLALVELIRVELALLPLVVAASRSERQAATS